MADTPRLADAELLAALAPLVRVITTAMQETPITLGSPQGAADLAAVIAVRVAAYVGREVLPPPDEETKKLRLRAEIAEAELATLRGGIRELGGDPTQVQNLYAQLRLRTNQWKAARDSNTRVRLVACDPESYDSPADVIRAVCHALNSADAAPEPSC
ncbi:hypothetical protein [Streptomyces bobili]|uniref:hypothetical protein n=1 Tax=Streptomyces bobili TaxID=67280 RepID=UPI003799D2C3